MFMFLPLMFVCWFFSSRICKGEFATQIFKGGFYNKGKLIFKVDNLRDIISYFYDKNFKSYFFPEK